MRELIGRAIVASIAAFCFGSLAITLLAKPCEVCCRPALFTARILGRRRIRVCWRDRQILRAKKITRSKPRRPVRSAQPTRREP